MIQLKRFDRVNEALGIAEATLFYIDLLKGRCIVEILDFVSEDQKLNQVEKKNIRFRYTNLRKWVTNWELYQDFPVSEIQIELSMVKKRPDLLKEINRVSRKEEIVPFTIGGYALPFATGREKSASRFKDPIKINMDHTISIHLEVEFAYSTNLIMDKDEKRIELNIESLLLHELNHAFEFYKRRVGGESDIEYTTTWTALMSNKMKRPKVIFKYWQNNFTDYIYKSEPHEVRAYIQEAKAYVDRMDFDSFQKTTFWKVVKIMENFDIKDFISRFDKVVYDYNPDYVGKMTNTLIKDFLREYENLSKQFKEENQIKPGFLRKMSSEEFLNFWEMRIRRAGEVMKKKMIRLYNYKKEKEEELI